MRITWDGRPDQRYWVERWDLKLPPDWVRVTGDLTGLEHYEATIAEPDGAGGAAFRVATAKDE